jgi:hypothetical protein
MEKCSSVPFEDEKMNRRVCSLISWTVDPRFHYVIDECSNSVETMSCIKKPGCPDHEVAKSGLRKNLYTLRFKPGTPVQEWSIWIKF